MGIEQNRRMPSRRNRPTRYWEPSVTEKVPGRCYPCAKRRIRCSGGRLCTPCSHGGHPDICFFENGSSIQPRLARKRAQNASSSPAESADVPGSTTAAGGVMQSASVEHFEPEHQRIAGSATSSSWGVYQGHPTSTRVSIHKIRTWRRMSELHLVSDVLSLAQLLDSRLYKNKKGFRTLLK